MGESFLVGLTMAFPILFLFGGLFIVWATGGLPPGRKTLERE